MLIARYIKPNILSYSSKQIQISRFYAQNNNGKKDPILEENMSEEKKRLLKELEELEAEFNKEYINEKTGEIGGPKGPEPTRYGDWERKGRISDF